MPPDDVGLVRFEVGRSARPGFNGNVNEDMVVDQDDLDAVLFNFGGVCP